MLLVDLFEKFNRDKTLELHRKKLDTRVEKDHSVYFSWFKNPTPKMVAL